MTITMSQDRMENSLLSLLGQIIGSQELFRAFYGAYCMRARRARSRASEIMEQSCHPHDNPIGLFLFRKAQGEMIDPLHMLEAMGKIGEITVVNLHRCFHLCQHVDCVFGTFHIFPPICHESSVGRKWLKRYSSITASENGFLFSW